MIEPHRRLSDPQPLSDRDRRRLARLAEEVPRLTVVNPHRCPTTGWIEGVGHSALLVREIIGCKTLGQLEECARAVDSAHPEPPLGKSFPQSLDTAESVPYVDPSGPAQEAPAREPQEASMSNFPSKAQLDQADVLGAIGAMLDARTNEQAAEIGEAVRARVATGADDEPEAVRRARAIVEQLNPEKVRRVGYTRQEAAALQTIRNFESRKTTTPQETKMPASTSRTRSPGRPAKTPTTSERYSANTWNDEIVKALGSGFAVFAHWGDLNPGDQLVFVGLFAGKSRQHDVAGKAREALGKLITADDGVNAKDAKLVSFKPSHARTTPELVELAETPAADEPAPAPADEPAPAPADEPAPGDDGPTHVEVEGVIVAETQHIDVPTGDTPEFKTGVARELIADGKVPQLKAFAKLHGIDVTPDETGKAPKRQNYVDAIEARIAAQRGAAAA